ncbi:unnamed protein product [Protopolystoma xenopodis]|uniref:Uncharacterized protein n=1 Tax=Protopolystoma xenopodis TaxID=117903 RepID=A0A3S4ZSR4_9PLAT|nr:unnamed protein product [Protopolystoma xenopodis]
MLFLLSVATRQPSDAELIEIATQKGTTNSNSPFFALSGLGSGGGMPSTTGNGTDIVSGSGGGPGRLFGGSGRTGVSAASGGIVNNANNGPVSSIVGISSSPTGGCAGPEASSGSQTVSSSATGIDREDRDDVSPANAVLNVPLSQLMVAAAAAAAAGLSQDAYASALSQPASHHHQQQQSQHHHQALIPTPGNSVAAVGLTASPAGCNSLSGLMRLCRR